MTQPAQPSERKLGSWACTALVMGNMIGSGVFLLPASLAPFGWNAVAGWIATICGGLLLAFTIAKLATTYPSAGGPVGFVQRAFGQTSGFMIGWSYWVSIWTANVTLAVAAVSYLSVFFPLLNQHPALATLGLVWLVTGLNLLGARAVGNFQIATLFLKLIPLIVVIGLAAWVLTLQGSRVVTPFPTEGFSLVAIQGSAILTLWALLGFESAAIAADKVKDAATTVPRATIIGTLATGLLYLFVCSAIALMLPQADLVKSPAPFGLFVDTYWRHEPALLVSAFAAISAIGALNGWTLLQAELPAAMAQRGLLPRWLAHQNRHGTAVRALLLSSVVGSIFILLNSQKSTGDLFAFMAKLSTSATLWLYLGVAAAALRLHVARFTAGAGLLYAGWTLWGAGLEVSLLSWVLMVAGLPIYWWTRRSGTPAETSGKTAAE